ncbi:MAG: 5'-nucleotidase C-terminal domain-containing protein [Spirochaetia bacterium]|nr:5'-nucleotidase C-terminal domain-containing protein [Spirochaetia bacterium]MCF7941728.1 5'-nucleotidase C-terminal domain-containing protein [Spirochaetia bacterium]
MKKQTLLRFMVGLALIISLVGCQTKAPEVAVVEAEKPVVVAEPAKEEVVVEAPAPVEEPVAEEPVVEEPVVEVVEEVVMEDLSVKLIMTSDVNGKLFPYDVVNGKSTDTSLAQIYSFVADNRADKDQAVVLLDGGNVLQGDLVVDYYNNFKSGSEHIVASVMNAMGYDAAVPGADDVAVGQDLFVKVGMESDFPWMAANAVDAKTGKPLTQPYTVIEKDGIKVAVLGMSSPEIAVPAGIELEDMVTTAKKWLPIIQVRENPDVIVGLFQTEGSKAGLDVAQQVRGFDVIFAGQKTSLTRNPDGKSIYVVGAQGDAKSVGTADITLSWDKASGDYMVSKVLGRTQAMASYPVSKAATAGFGYVIDELKAAVKTPVGYLEETLLANDSLFGDSAMVDLIHNLQLEMTGADVSFAAPPVANVKLLKGPITVQDILFAQDMFNVEDNIPWLYTGEMTGAEIDAYLEYSYANWFNQMKTIRDSLLGGLDYYNWDSAAGINYIVDVRKPAGEKVKITTNADGSKFDMDKTYTVVMNAYRANDVGGFLSKGVGLSAREVSSRVISSYSVDLMKGFMMGDKMLGKIVPEVDNNWFASPIIWAKRGMEKDMMLLK